MELFSTEFFAALVAIIVIDLVLAGDNAIVIALAARNVPAHLRKRAIVWGTVGAIVVRTAMTLVVVWLLRIPGLLAAGGLALVWIAVKLLKEEASDNGHGMNAADSFWGAMKTIVIADAVMGLDNVLAVAGAAHGSFLLVVLGLLISVPIVIWGSALILNWVERFPMIIYVGAGVLAWTAARMLLGEPLFNDFLASYPWVNDLTYAVVLVGVLGGGFLWNHHPLRKRVERHLLDADHMAVTGAVRTGGERVKVLIPVDGSASALGAVRCVAGRFANGAPIEVHLVTVLTPISQDVARFFRRQQLDAFHEERAGRTLGGARMILDRARVPYACHVELGPSAESINTAAERLGVHCIVVGTARRNTLTRLIQDSVTARLLKIAKVPVEVIVGEDTPLERFALSAGLAAALAVIVAVAVRD